MAEWFALSDQQAPLSEVAGDLDGIVARGMFVLEYALPLDGPTVLLDYRAHRGWDSHLSVFADPQSGVSLLHRQGAGLVRHTLATPLPQERGTGRVLLAWDGPGRRWCLGHEVVETGVASVTQGSGPIPFPMGDVMALARGAGVQHRAGPVLWFGFADGLAMPDRFPWVGPRTPIATPRGLVPAGLLVAGDMVLTIDHGPLPLAAVRRHHVPTRGSHTPVLLRAPYFPAHGDMLVSSDQLILLSGSEVEYLFGEEEVLVEAHHLVNGITAMLDTRRAMTLGIELDFGLPVIALSDGCRLGLNGAQDAQATQPRRRLHGFEAVPLMSMMTRTAQTRTG